MKQYLKYANTEAGKHLLGVDPKHTVYQLFSNGWRVKKGKQSLYRFYCYDRVLKVLDPILSQMEIAEDTSYKAFLHYSDLERKPHIYPTIYLATTSYFAGAGDGYVRYQNTGDSFATAHGATAGTSADPTNAGAITTGVTRYAATDTDWEIDRAFFPFDTSGLADGTTITAATLNLYVNEVVNQDNDGDDWVNVVQTSQADTSTLATADYDQCGAVSNPTEGATRIDQGSLTASAYNVWTLNATGRSWVDKTGFTKLGIRQGHDAINSQITWGGAQTRNRVRFNASEDGGTNTDPYLEVVTLDEGGFIYMSV
jgi:hypothetical protein